MNRQQTLIVLVLAAFLSIVTVFLVKQSQQVAVPPPDKEEPELKPELKPPPATTPLTIAQAVKSIQLAPLKTHLYHLSSKEFEGRMSGKKGNVMAAKYLKDFHEKNKLKTEYQKFSIRRLNPGPNNEQGDDFTQNIFAWIEGSDPVLKKQIVVLGAHMDHIGYGPSYSRSRSLRQIHPGADDNASGTVVVMEVAKAMSKMKAPARTVVFQHYSAEEMGLIGARYYCNNPTFPKGNPDPSNDRRLSSHIAMINLDMVGYLGRGVYFAGFQAADSSVDLGEIVNDLNSEYDFARRITSRGSGGSDHACFYNKRVPVAFLHTGSHQHYHTPTDTPDRINYEGLTEVARYTLELVYNIANSDHRPRFYHTVFRPMEYKHDHGHPSVPFIHQEKD